MDFSNFVFFPYMHSKFVPDEFKDKGILLNPGLSSKHGGTFTPEGYILEPRQATRRLDEFYRFGAQFSNPKDMGYYAVEGFEDFYSDTVMAIKSELTGGSGEENKEQEKCVQMQSMLLLGFALEERILEIGRLGEEAKETWKKFEDTLGLSGEDGEGGLAPFPQDTEPVDSLQWLLQWPKLFPAFAYFMPQEKSLLVWEEEIVEELKSKAEEMEVPPETNSHEMVPVSLESGDKFYPKYIRMPVSAFSLAVSGKKDIGIVFFEKH